MERQKVFLSYSRQDEASLLRLRIHLKPWDDQGLLDIWSDQRLAASQKWHTEIQQALATTAVAVLLVSPDFLASHYIRTQELPVLVQACEAGDMALTCLYLTPSTVDDDDMAVALEDGSRIKLTQYQGLNDPRRPLSSLLEHEQEALYAHAASTIKQLIQQRVPPAQRTASGRRYDLTVQFVRRNTQLIRHYLHHYGRFAEYRSPWPEVGNQDLFTLLFGSQEHCDKVLRLLFDVEFARPLLHPVRVRLHTTEPHLAALPWAQMMWHTERLHEHGWTFQLLNRVPEHGTQDLPLVILKAPCPVLLITPSSAPQADVHHRAWEERLSHAWPSYHEPPQWVHDWAGLQHAWQRRRPPIVYYYGPADSDGSELLLHFDAPDGQMERRPLTDLAQVWGAHPPDILFCNVLGQHVPSGTVLADVPGSLRIVQYSHDATTARRAALAWIQAVLEGGEDVDPVAALHQHGLPTAMVWSGYGIWQTRTTSAPARHTLARLLLDRIAQRSVGSTAVRDLVQDGNRRLSCVLAYGAEGNLAQAFPAQLLDHLQSTTREIAQVLRVPLRLPASGAFTLPELALEVYKHLGIADVQGLGTALTKRKPQGPGAARPVLFLDWGVRGASLGTPLRLESLVAWLTLCSQYLCAQCPRDVRLMACLTLEIPAQHHATLKQEVERLRAQAGVRDRAFRLYVLDPLGQVGASDLADFLEGTNNASCPDDLLPQLPELIVRKTGGQFEPTVSLIEEAERTSWYELYDALVEEFGPGSGATPPGDLVL